MAWKDEERREAIEHICREMALGRPLIKICEDEGMPGYSTVMAWRAKDADFQEMYARAREEQADWHAEQILIIADTEEDPNRARVRIDARKWAASKLKPKVYGERINVDGDINLRLSDEQVESRLAHIIGKAGAALALGREGTEESEA